MFGKFYIIHHPPLEIQDSHDCFKDTVNSSKNKPTNPKLFNSVSFSIFQITLFIRMPCLCNRRYYFRNTPPQL